MSTPEWSHPIRIEDVPGNGTNLTLRATDEDCARLAMRLGVEAVLAMGATVRVVPVCTGRLEITGVVEGQVRQICGVSLDEIDFAIREELSVEAVPEDEFDESACTSDEIMSDPEAFLDAPDLEPIIDGAVDLGELCTQYFALGIDANPRHPQLDRVEYREDSLPVGKNPFSALAELKRQH
jgi:hypothetical protein